MVGGGGGGRLRRQAARTKTAIVYTPTPPARARLNAWASAPQQLRRPSLQSSATKTRAGVEEKE
jgi:hypothetical protein